MPTAAFRTIGRRMTQAPGRDVSGRNNNNMFRDIIRQMQAAQEKANLMNEQRYQQILGQYENLGQAGRTRIEQQTQQRQAEATQNLTSRGLGNTTITSAVERGISSDAELQRQQLEETVAMQKAGVMERRTDTGPDLGMFANLLQSAGQQQQPRQRSTATIIGGNVFSPKFRPGITGVQRAPTPRPRATVTRNAGTAPVGWIPRRRQ